MCEKTLSVAVIGAGPFGMQMLRALRSLDQVQLVAVGDKDPALCKNVVSEFGIETFGDNRLLLESARPQVVFMSVPPSVGAEIVSACAKRGIHLWKDTPLARSLEEGVVLARMMDKANCKFAVGTQRRFVRSYLRAKELSSKIGQVFLARAHYLFNWSDDLGWRGDKEAAGGGALLELGYHPIDMLLWMLSLPSEAYGLVAGGRPAPRGDHPRPVYDTDDTAGAILKYDNELIATVVTTRSSGPVSEELSLHGEKGSITVNGDRCIFRDPDGSIVDQTENDLAPGDIFVSQAEAFVNAVLEDSPQYYCSAMENLLNQAVVEAIYLSNRTGQAESIEKILKTHRITVDECFMHTPSDAEPAAESEPEEENIFDPNEDLGEL